MAAARGRGAGRQLTAAAHASHHCIALPTVCFTLLAPFGFSTARLFTYIKKLLLLLFLQMS
jgi:cyanate permease